MQSPRYGVDGRCLDFSSNETRSEICARARAFQTFQDFRTTGNIPDPLPKGLPKRAIDVILDDIDNRQFAAHVRVLGIVEDMAERLSSFKNMGGRAE
jgi:hypothetical protein